MPVYLSGRHVYAGLACQATCQATCQAVSSRAFYFLPSCQRNKNEMANSTSLRAAMPQNTAWIDELRSTFGAAFHASENSHEIGRKDERAGIPLSQCQLTRNEAAIEAASAKNARRGK
jgi:hypothetical protein